jgi:hypothetical protein
VFLVTTYVLTVFYNNIIHKTGIYIGPTCVEIQGLEMLTLIGSCVVLAL